MALTAAEALRELGAGTNDFDYLRVSGDSNLLKFLDRHAEQTERGVSVEKIVFSDEIIKINKRNKLQKRDLIITNIFIYNFESKKYNNTKRDIPIRELRGLLLCETNGEMLIQVKNDYDYRLLIVRAADVIQSLMKLFHDCTGMQLPLMVTQENLSKFQVLKGEVRKFSHRDSGAFSAALTRIRQGTKDSFASVGGRNRHDSQTGAAGGVNHDATLEAKPSMEGWISKRGEVNNQWRLRYFRLNETNLLYYEARLRSNQNLERGDVKQWINKRISVEASEYKSSNLGPSHLYHILREPERAKAFLRYSRSQSSSASNNVEFYLSIEQFKEIPPIGSSALLSNNSELNRIGICIYNDYCTPNAPKEISLSLDSRLSLGNLIKSMKNEFTHDFYDEIQLSILQYLQSSILPGYLEFSKLKSQQDEIYKIKNELSELDKKQSNCSHCLTSLSGFSIFSKRQLCRHCGEVHCKECLHYEAILPEEFGVADPVKVCDMCNGVLTYGNHPHAFSYVSPKCRPINLAAPSAADMTSWMNAFQAVVGSMDPSTVRVRKEGWLMLEMPNKSWRRTYLILDSNRLYYYELKLKGSVALGEGAGVHASNEVKATLNETDCDTDGLQSESNFAFRFNISYKQRLYLLSADTESTMFQWIEAVNKAIRKRQYERNRPALADQYSEAFHEEAPIGDVTFVFTDVQNSTKLWEAAAEGMNQALEKHDALLRRLLKDFKGYEVKTEGDAFMVTFFNPLDAIRWCLAVQKALLEIQWSDELLRLPAANQVYSEGKLIWNGIRIRMGIHTGAPACRRNPVTGRMDYFGPVVNRSARVADSAHGGQVICTEEVHRSLTQSIASGEWKEEVKIEDLNCHKYKGIGEPVRVYQLSSPELLLRNPFPQLRTKEEGDDKSKSSENVSGGGISLVAHEGEETEAEVPEKHSSLSLTQTMRKNRARNSASMGRGSLQNVFLQAPTDAAWDNDNSDSEGFSGSFEIAPELLAHTNPNRNKLAPANSLCVAINLANSSRIGEDSANNLFYAASQKALQMSFGNTSSILAGADSTLTNGGSLSSNGSSSSRSNSFTKPAMPRRPAPSISVQSKKFDPIMED